MPRRIRKPKPRKGRVEMPPPARVMRDRRARRPTEDLRRELDEIAAEIDAELEELAQEYDL